MVIPQQRSPLQLHFSPLTAPPMIYSHYSYHINHNTNQHITEHSPIHIKICASNVNVCINSQGLHALIVSFHLLYDRTL